MKLNLSDCFQNGPPFQAQLLDKESQLLTVDSLLKSFSKSSKVANEAGEVTAKASRVTAETIESIGKFEAKSGEDENGIIVQFSSLLKSIEHDRKEMFKNIDSFVNDPLENHFKSDFIHLKELKKKYEKEKFEFAYAYSRYMSKRPKDVGILESAQEVAILRRDLHETVLSLSIHLNEMADKKSTFVYQSLSNYLQCRLEFAERETQKLKEIKGHLDGLAKEKIVTPDEHKERLMNNFLTKNSIISKSSSSYNPLTNSNQSGSDGDPNRNGYLYKRSSHTLRPVWSRRFFSLKGDKLIYYSLEGKGDQARVSIDLRLCHVQAVDDPERRFCFDLISPIRGYRLQTENECELNGWIDSIRSGTILALQKSASSGQADAAKSISKEFGLTRETGHEDLIHSILSMNQIELSLSAAKKEEISLIPGNSLCADCRSKDPDWASLSFGILICIKCSGIHRSLGVHLSKVRSLALDFWNPEHVELMKCIGNERSWEIFEEGYEPGGIQRPDGESSQSAKEKWIAAKYVNRQFVKLPCNSGNDNVSEEELVREMMWSSIESGDVVGCLKALALGALVDDTIEIVDDNQESVVIVQSAVQRAAQLKRWTLVALILLWGADTEYVDTLGRNLVHYLAAIPDLNVSVLLTVLRKNAGLGGWEDRNGRTSLQYAEESANAPVATIIRIFQAQMDEATAVTNKGPLSAVSNNNAIQSGQESPALSSAAQTPITSMNAAFEKLLNHYGGQPYKPKK